MKKSLLILFIGFMCMQIITSDAFAYSNINVEIEGKYVWFDEQSPIIVEGRTLVPIRRVAEIIGATVEWESSTETITIIKGAITLGLKIGNKMMYVNDETVIELDVAPKIYNSKTLLPIRAILEKLGYEVQWYEEERTIRIEEMGSVIIHNLDKTHVNYVRNWANISSIQQFYYKDEGLAYAYIKDDNLQIITPNKEISLEIKYPILGDVISDSKGNFYVVWGKIGENNLEQTIFISKYTQEGIHVNTTGFIGKSIMGADGNTKIPFDAGNCVSVIGEYNLMVNYAREMHSGHQSNNVIGVKLSDMSAVTWSSVWDIPYTSHSFNQTVIWSDKYSNFIYADHGDAYGRGFVITYGKEKKLLFNFYLQANANYNMYVVNETFAQLGNIAETGKGIALVGASVKSISEAAKKEKQNLFVQIFNPSVEGVSSQMFIGGEDRSGSTSTDINDNNNSPLKKITDYGVIWLTDYTETDVVAPQVVAADDKLIILWSTENDSFYMILSAEGEILTPATSLGGVPLNSYERPIYHNGSIYWVSVHNERMKIRRLEI